MVSEHKFDSKLSPIRASAVDLQHLRYAVAAADHGSFRRAAEVLLLQQSTLSRCISQLEHSLGMTIFERFSGGVRATTAGRHFLRGDGAGEGNRTLVFSLEGCCSTICRKS